MYLYEWLDTLVIAHLSCTVRSVHSSGENQFNLAVHWYEISAMPAIYIDILNEPVAICTFYISYYCHKVCPALIAKGFVWFWYVFATMRAECSNSTHDILQLTYLKFFIKVICLNSTRILVRGPWEIVARALPLHWYDPVSLSMDIWLPRRWETSQRLPWRFCMDALEHRLVL